jgi:hypothetical protein
MICVMKLRCLREMVLTYSGFRHLTLSCLQTNVLPQWLSSTLRRSPLHHKMTGYEGMINDHRLMTF